MRRGRFGVHRRGGTAGCNYEEYIGRGVTYKHTYNALRPTNATDTWWFISVWQKGTHFGGSGYKWRGDRFRSFHYNRARSETSFFQTWSEYLECKWKPCAFKKALFIYCHLLEFRKISISKKDFEDPGRPYILRFWKFSCILVAPKYTLVPSNTIAPFPISHYKFFTAWNLKLSFCHFYYFYVNVGECRVQTWELGAKPFFFENHFSCMCVCTLVNVVHAWGLIINIIFFYLLTLWPLDTLEILKIWNFEVQKRIIY